MRLLLFLMYCFIVTNNCHGQLNLVFNGSFEEFTPPIPDPDWGKVMVTPEELHQFSENIPCWYTTKPNGTYWDHAYVFLFSPSQPLYGSEYYVFYSSELEFWRGKFNFYIDGASFPLYFEDIYGAPGSNIVTEGYSLMSAAHGDNYLALISCPIVYSGYMAETHSYGWELDESADPVEI